MSAESMAIRNIDRNRERRIELSPTMIRAHERATKEVLTNPQYVIQETDFEGVYDENSIRNDLAEVERLQKIFDEKEHRSPQARNNKKISEVFETIMLMQSEMGEWLGSNANTLKTSRYDDFKNKVDMVVEWSSEDGSRVLALAVDITFGESHIKDKLTEIQHEIDRGKLGSIRYFKDEAGNFMGTRQNVVRTVVGISEPVVEELAHLWLENKNKNLGEHPIQKVILDQIGFQLSKMQQYALRLGKYDVADQYQQALLGLKKVREEKQTIATDALREDPVRKEIIAQTKQIFG